MTEKRMLRHIAMFDNERTLTPHSSDLENNRILMAKDKRLGQIYTPTANVVEEFREDHLCSLTLVSSPQIVRYVADWSIKVTHCSFCSEY